MQAKLEYKSLTDTLKCLRHQVIDSLPYISQYIPNDIEKPEDLFYFLRDKIKYKKDPPGIELLQSVQTLLSENNKHGKPGLGDCDCFTILALASCYYLGFEPQQVALVGNSKISPSHIYSLVFDRNKNKMCSMDLTNPYYDVERPYNYKQTLPFVMKLELADNYFPLASKASRKAKKAIKKTAKVEKKKIKQAGKVARVAARVKKRTTRREQKTARKVTTQQTRTDRRVQKGQRKEAKRAVKVGKKEKKLIRVQGKQDIIKARQNATLNRINQQQQQETFAPDFSPESDQSYLPDEQTLPGSSYMAPDASEDFYNYEQMPEDTEGEYNPEDEYYEGEEDYGGDENYEDEDIYGDQMQDLGLPGLPGAAFKLISKITQAAKSKVAQVKSSKAGNLIKKGSSAYNEIIALKNENASLKLEVQRESKNKYIYGGVGTGMGTLVGILIGRATK